MRHKEYSRIMKTPTVLRGFDVEGEVIVFSRAYKEKELWINNEGNLQKLTRGFSPILIGDDILYTAEVNDRTDIFLYHEKMPLALTKEGRNVAPQPSPDRKFIAFLSDRGGPLGLYKMDLEKKDCTHVFTPELPLSMRPFVWSPDGRYIVYWTQETPMYTGGIWRLNVETAEVERLIYFPKSSLRVGNPYIWYLSRSLPFSQATVWIDEDKFIFISDVKGYDSLGISTLEGEIEWTDDKSTKDKEFYHVSPDGTWVAYNEFNDGTTHLVFFSLSEGLRKEVLINGCLSCPQWSKKGVYCWGSSPIEGTGILYIPLKGEPQYCYRELPPFSTFQPVPLHYKTFDNRCIGGWLYNPEARKVLVWLHGGPADICLNNFDPVIQYFALHGFAVFAPNFRGSLGYGREFKRLNWNDLGGGDLNDVREGIFYLESLGYGPFVVGGQSYGGYLASMVLVKYPQLCEGGFSISGMYVLFPEFASSFLINSGCIWMDLTDHELLENRSPACHIENLENPILIIHGFQDQYTPVSQLQYMLERAREAKKDNLMHVILYNDEGHGISREENREETYKKINSFLDNILGST
ncbi:MAG: S9 family peptidase [Theionarchaea archaeon]|nr:S9 family peptidase [Theionarchaea archaeon]